MNFLLGSPIGSDNLTFFALWPQKMLETTSSACSQEQSRRAPMKTTLFETCVPQCGWQMFAKFAAMCSPIGVWWQWDNYQHTKSNLEQRNHKTQRSAEGNPQKDRYETFHLPKPLSLEPKIRTEPKTVNTRNNTYRSTPVSTPPPEMGRNLLIHSLFCDSSFLEPLTESRLNRYWRWGCGSQSGGVISNAPTSSEQRFEDKMPFLSLLPSASDHRKSRNTNS